MQKSNLFIIFLSLTILLIFIWRNIMANEQKDLIHMTLKDGLVVIETLPEVAPKHVSQIKQLILQMKYCLAQEV